MLHDFCDGRGGPIRTDDPLLPKQMRYQAAPRPDILSSYRRGTKVPRRPQTLAVRLVLSTVMALPFSTATNSSWIGQTRSDAKRGIPFGTPRFATVLCGRRVEIHRLH